MNKTKKLEIKAPCNQSWEEMQVLGEGRYCQSCNHIIHDFSDVSNEELIQILQSGKHSCGRFDKKQMGLVYAYKDEKKMTSPYWKGIAAAIVAGTLQLSIVQAQQPNSHKLYPKSYLGIKGDPETDQHPYNVQQDSLTIHVLDDYDNWPIANAIIKIGKTELRSDLKGKAVFKWDAVVDSTLTLHITVSKKEYKTYQVKLALSNNTHKSIRIDLRKVNAKKREYIMGFY